MKVDWGLGFEGVQHLLCWQNRDDDYKIVQTPLFIKFLRLDIFQIVIFSLLSWATILPMFDEVSYQHNLQYKKGVVGKWVMEALFGFGMINGSLNLPLSS